MELQICKHLKEITKVKKAKAYVCEECIQTCGATLCCDSSPNQHMTEHFNVVGHPVASSAEPGEKWLYCYADDLAVDY